nr:hypothetical protein [uncultured Campylobacter sp.]
MSRENSKFSGSCEDAESLNLSEQSSDCELNLSDENSAATLNLNDQNLSNQSFAAIGIASMSNLDSENSSTGATASLNFKNKNSATADIIATSKTMAGAAKTGSYNERRRSKNDENSAKRY